MTPSGIQRLFRALASFSCRLRALCGLRGSVVTQEIREDRKSHAGVRVRIPTHRAPTHPGEDATGEFLKPLGISQVEFAKRIKVPLQRVNEIVRGRPGVTPGTALRLEAALGASAQFWPNLQLAYDLYEYMHAPDAAEIRKIRRVKPDHRATA